jgi:hypothetical protein
MVAGTVLGVACSSGSRELPRASDSLSTVEILTSDDIPADGVAEGRITAIVRDADGEALAGLPVRFAASGVGATVTPESSRTDGAGRVSAAVRSTRAEHKTVEVAAGAADAAVVFRSQASLRFVPTAPSADASSLEVESRGYLAADGGGVAILRAVVRDAHDNPVPAQEVRFAADGTDNVLVQPSGPTDEQGLVTATLAATRAGARSVEAFVDGPGGSTRVAGPVRVEFFDRPFVQGVGSFVDANGDRRCGAGDLLELAFDQDVALPVPGLLADEVLDLPVADDAFGQGARVFPGGAPNRLTVVLGEGARLRMRATFDPARLASHESSGVDVRGALPSGALVSAVTRLTAAPRIAVDLSADWARAPVSLGAGVACVVAGDLDGDGDPDLAQGCRDGSIRVWWNGREAGGSQTSSGHALAEPVASLCLADLDHDGDLDLVVAGALGALNAYTNLGGRTFDGPVSKLPVGGAAIVAADLDRDGGTELVLAGADGRLWIVSHARDGPVVDAQALPLGAAARAVLAADLDADGDLDLIAHRPDAVVTWRNAGGLRFVPAAELPLADVRALAALDVDRDGDLDLLAGGLGGVHLLRRVGPGAWQDEGVSIAAPVQALALLDGDADGDLDALCTGPEGTAVWRNDGGAFAAMPAAFRGSAGVGLALSDLDLDGADDAVLIKGEGPAEAWRSSLSAGRGEVGFVQDPRVVPALTPTAAATADLDRDGDTDLVLAQGGGGTRVLLGEPDGSLRDSGQLLGAVDSTLALALGDVDGDGDVDIVTGNTAGAAERLYLNDGAGGFSESPHGIGAGHTSALALGDVDGDGDLDLLTANFGTRDDGDRLFVNDGSGRFADSGQRLGRGTTRALALGDLDGDGDLDLITADASGPSSLWLNDGLGRYTAAQELPAVRVGGVVLGDVDRDGDLDAFVGVDFGGPDLVWLNDGRGTLSDSGQRLGAAHTTDVRLIDADGDGDLDAVASVFGGAAVLWRNDGAGRFAAAPLPLAASTAVTTADLDRDGDADLLFICTDHCVRVVAAR